MNGDAIFVLGVFSGTAFYVLGTCLAVLAIVVTAIGLRSADAFSSKAVVRGGLLIFAVLVVGTTIFAVQYSRYEQDRRRAELAAEEQKAGATPISGGGEIPSPDASPATGESGPSQPAAGSGAKGPGGTVKVAADPTQLLFDQKALTSKPGKVTIDFNNPAQIQHDVVIEQGGRDIAKTELIAQGKTTTSAELAPGTYVYYCDVPGHREAGMEGRLTVK